MIKDRPAVQTGSDRTSSASEALRSIRFIRQAISRSETFTAVPGWGGAWMGVIGLAAAGFASTQTSAADWLLAWLAAALVAASIGSVSIVRKARRFSVPVLAGAGRKFALGILPAVFAASILTMVMYQTGLADRLPGLWLLMFGVAVVTASFASIRPVLIMGVLYMVLGVMAFIIPASWGDVMMALGFGGLNIFFGILIGLRHGG